MLRTMDDGAINAHLCTVTRARTGGGAHPKTSWEIKPSIFRWACFLCSHKYRSNGNAKYFLKNKNIFGRGGPGVA